MFLLLRPFRFFPRSVSFFLLQITDPFQHIDIHKKKIIGDEEYLVLNLPGRQIIAPISQPVEEELHPKQHPVECRRTARQQNRHVQWQECEQQERSDRPPQHPVRRILKAEHPVAERVQQSGDSFVSLALSGDDWQYVKFYKPVSCRFVRMTYRCDKESASNSYVGCNEFNAIASN